MMNDFRLTSSQMNRVDILEKKYKQLYLEPDNCEPLVHISFPIKNDYTIKELLADPEKMFSAELNNIKAHFEVGDDVLPMTRVGFGTAQIASAFGCEIKYSDDSLPACESSVLKNAGDVMALKMPTLSDGMTPKLLEFTKYFLENLPEGVVVQHPDVQSAFNSAYLIRGNDILLDFYDEPEMVTELLKKTTDFMLLWINESKKLISNDKEWFYDAGGLWKGGARLSNCTMQIISPNIYRDFVMAEDERFLDEMNGGRVHYCGSNEDVIYEFFKLRSMTAIEIDCQYHDLIEISEIAPPNVTVKFCDWSIDKGNGKWLSKLLAGEIPNKKNIVINPKADNMEEAKRLYYEIKNKICV